ncbi:acetyl-CoA carboxylase biotin carboxyl carrier protein [Clostridium luticellarii]|jgi:acetyl-CoA carboxylase biotin carboxyl carrier protein|uniref:Biotin carboxyl carrier protein of acetyl-CoA carboxylase n=1 Tax=Clostridium luticellarii TaxID=1691940 RepID=A0A2T0BP37_9CLOT|nr:acetyl-CoA carboxylase biotin carboxyl carrier protein [Clostridium luticellarii]MCI1944640.1 acetyl-CoA carboxylase biotin carboxyl carrier protein [Clostridium luticellarii]MCI1968139.1 acetyl-CoA carboxylase biotin carboxyl carrier protein [Clostridium luticellarii]MCI1994748.1 acetyl-CoA carboxylase biotin carboxyl carrier protein [Clostridium luticellarii]MCI2038980.1 acetyl-CoA carboxylase biotin carboxyl carrier protein [Clostridium luticellarii]PRR85644.1 Biotin carboxyl carrier pro
MDFKAIENIIKIMDDSKLGYLEINWQGISIVMKKEGEKQGTVLKKEDCKGADDTPNELGPPKKEKISQLEKDNIKEVTSPIVGTFYSSPGPEKPAFVNVGSKVKKGDTLCVIEAMKLMNEIQSEVDGEVVDILPKNKQMVEYGELLFKIKVGNM